MFTVCPKCTLTLVVTTVDLRAGQGYVRCGRCANVFNALIALREGDGAARTALARFFAENIAVTSSGLERSVTEGAQSITDADAALA